MKLIVGLGNPGSQYEKTRHNAGFMAVDLLAGRDPAAGPAKSKFGAAAVECSVGGGRCLLVKPTGYMNRSGPPVRSYLDFFKLDPASDLLVVVDDLALPVGSIRVRAGGGAGGHNGLKDIDRVLGGAAYARLRIGIGAVPSGWRQDDWVLSRFDPGEAGDLERAIRDAADAAELWRRDGVDAAMNRFNAKLEGPGGSGAVGRDRTGGDDSAARAANDDVHPGWSGGW